VSWQYAIAYIVLVLIAGQLETAGAILIEELGFGRYPQRDLMLVAGWGLLELFWYRPLTAFWRAWVTILFLTVRRPGWGKIPRGLLWPKRRATSSP
jgi:biofilm PGA synthesis N-glycosyltransferase PgaC